jgi:hypothetical protein
MVPELCGIIWKLTGLTFHREPVSDSGVCRKSDQSESYSV